MASCKPFKHLSILLILLLSFTSSSRCTLGLPLGGSSLTVMTYNVENLFDDIDNGTEYSDYDPGEGAWSTESFHAKLANISEVLRTAGSNGVDIIALQEVESAHALDLLKDSYLNGMGYRYAVISPDEGAAVRVSFLSRLPLQDVRTHRVQVKGEYPSRSLLEVRVEFHGHSLVLINCHWKSKSGGARKTEEQRLAASELIVLRLKELFREDPGVNVIILGDLNENPDEFLQIQKSYQTALLPNEDDIPLEYAKRSLFVV